MGEIEGTYRALQASGTRTGAPVPGSGQGPAQRGPLAPAGRTGMQEKHLPLRVQLLDGSVELFDIEPRCDGRELLAQVWRRLNVVEADYFGLEFQNVPSYWIWLEPLKPIIRQVRRPRNTVLRLAVKFFPPDPGQLQEEHTRYLFVLQLKRDLLEERLTCHENTAALLAAHLLQAEIGDYDELLDREHLSASEYLPAQERSLEKILEFHRKHVGQTPAESDFQVLEIARKLEMYGLRFHVASDREGTKINLSVSHMGVLVLQGTARINTFNWSKVRKLSFKRKRFLIKLYPEVHGPYQDTLEFLLGSRDECKNFWKICVEYHTFFRLSDQPKPKAKGVFFSRGSSFRYSGRTQKQLVNYVKDRGMKKIPYERRHSKTRASIRALTTDLPKQSVSLSEGMRTWTCPPPASATASGPACPVAPDRPDVKDSSASPPDPQAPSARSPAAERSPGSTATAPGAGGVQPCPATGPLQVSEEFIDDDPAEMSFFAGGSEAFSFPYGAAALQRPRAPAQPMASPSPGDPGSLRSSPDRYSTEAVHMDADGDSEFEEEDGLRGSGPPGAAELLGVTAQAGLLRSLLGPAEARALPLHAPSSAEQSGASSLVNFPACSVHSASSSAFQFSDVVDQLERLSYPPTATEGSSSPDSDSWDSEAEGPLGGGLFFSPFAPTSAERFAFDFQNNLKNLAREKQTDANPY
ncbi:FERM, ARHGEF and pleckstrin domain-containing protein 2 isoform X2 [Dasypus novemcinctus]|uniref:FERM, ARHGEF and pleckstrin domain-containing protein 2 isoform X2 n=1 Tax=Dasypus novemcinctus TaxID=9361 RepID=UPI0026600233|nr:FERM, ARHGEF and pleckstrin domain-containing protein 2 isoform X2 [Dasypus novemcinctus]